jgi:parallel beta-helix repeat protein
MEYWITVIKLRNDFMRKIFPGHLLTGLKLFFFLIIFICSVTCQKSTPGKGFQLRIECNESSLRSALDLVSAAGGGTIIFNASDTTILIEDRIYFYGNNMTLDGEDRNLTLKYIGPDSCNQTEGQDHFIEIHGDSNVIRNFTLIGFPDGIHVQSGYDNIVENVKFPIVCEDAVTNNGRGFEAFRTIIRGCYFEHSEDKAVMINNGGSATVDDCEFVDCMQPVRAGGRSGNYVIRNCLFRGRSTGPRFSGGKDGMTIVFENNTIHDAQYGIRVYGYVQAVICNNIFRFNDDGVYAYDSARVRLERNDIQDAKGVGVLLKGSVQADLGGGSVRINEDSTPRLGFNILKGNQEKDLVNQTNNTIMAMNNVWDHATVAEVLSQDVSGSVEVDPLGKSGGPIGIKPIN